MADVLGDLDATGVAELVRTKQASPLELVDAAIARIERVNPQINAVVTPLFESAREAAKGSLPDGPFRGVPFLVKDLIAMLKGVRNTGGTRLSKDWIAPADSELVARYRRAGLVFVGLTNTPEYGILPTTEPLLFGATRNPWDPTRTTGGSSGGSAAAVAARLVPFAHANDGGGSIRIPASCCGLFGLKPTRARNPLGPFMGDVLHGFVVEHAVTRSVRDSAALLDLTEGADPGAPYVAPAKTRPYLAEVGAPAGRLRIGVIRKSETGAPIHPDCVAATDDAVVLLRELGHEIIDDFALNLDGNVLTQAFITLWAGWNAWAVEETVMRTRGKPSPETLEPLTHTLWEMGRSVPAATYLGSLAALQTIARKVARAYERVDLLLTPTLAEPPVPLGSFDAQPGNPMAGLFRAATFTPFTPLCNLTGQPAMSVPLHWNAAGLPIGIQLAARFGDEPTLFRLAAQLEQARPWAHRKPAISA
jgi:amidase